MCEPEQGRDITPWVLTAASLASVAACAAAAALALSQGDLEPDGKPGLSPVDVLAAPERYESATIAVVGRADVLTEDAMTLGEHDLIVLAAEPSEQSFARRWFSTGDEVRVVGRLRVLDARGALARLPDRSLLPPQFQGFERQPVLFADQVAPT